ncbi:hypothetical protein [Streptomyces sp. NPDC008121]|uniref:hypothetical protein n=1 Tax=Streptomyces sp. NPDC008121 TaxID=3364809 RepID=UPI0036EDACF5
MDALLAEIARRLLAVDRGLARAQRERTGPVALIPTRARAARRALAHLRAIDGGLTRVLGLGGAAGDLVEDLRGSRSVRVDLFDGAPPTEPVDPLTAIGIRVDLLARVLVSTPAYEFPVDHSELRGWMRLFGRAFGLDIGLHSLTARVHGEGNPHAQVRELGETVRYVRSRVRERLSAGTDG